MNGNTPIYFYLFEYDIRVAGSHLQHYAHHSVSEVLRSTLIFEGLNILVNINISLNIFMLS